MAATGEANEAERTGVQDLQRKRRNLTASRKIKRGLVTKYCNEFDIAIQHQRPDVRELRKLLAKIENYFASLKEIDNQLLDVWEDEELESELEEAANYEDHVVQVRVDLEDYLQAGHHCPSPVEGRHVPLPGYGTNPPGSAHHSRMESIVDNTLDDQNSAILEDPPVPPLGGTSPVPQGVSGLLNRETTLPGFNFNKPSGLRNMDTRVKLPKISMPTFDGSLLGWQSFADRFLAIIDSNTMLSDVEKFLYLRSALSGEALRAVDSLSVAGQNYAVAWRILSSQFGQPTILIQANLQALQALPKLKEGASTTDIRALYDDCAARIHSLEVLNVEVEGMKANLSPLILSTLPMEWAVRFSTERGIVDIPSVTEVLAFMDLQLKIREDVENVRKFTMSSFGSTMETKGCSLSTVTMTSKEKDNSGSFKKKLPLGSFLMSHPELDSRGLKPSTGNKKTQRNGPSCAFCDKLGHWPAACQQYRTVDQRKDILRQKKRCFICLEGVHMASQCTSKLKFCRSCGQKHHHALCGTSHSEPSTSQSSSVNYVESTVLLRTGTVWVAGLSGKVRVRFLLDDGSQSSFVTLALAKKVGAPQVSSSTRIVRPFGVDQGTTKTMQVFELQLQGLTGGRIITITALGQEHICGSSASLVDPVFTRRLMEQGFPLAEDLVSIDQVKDKVELLIGSDHYWQVVTGAMHPISAELGAIETHFGWMVNGVVPADPKMSSLQVNLVTLEDQLKDFWSLEHSGLFPSATKSDNEVFSKFADSTKQDSEGRYIVRLPWRMESSELASNWSEAFRRFWSLVRRLHHDQNIRERYCEAMDAYFTMKHAEVLTNPHQVEERLYYIPHHAVIKEDRTTTKVRIVFDASSKAKGCKSLNECLHVGPSLNPECTNLLIRWRSYAVPIVADVVKAFLQVRLDDRDKDAVRFLWIKNDFWSGSPTFENFRQNLLICRMVVVIFGATSSPFLLCATIRHHASKYLKVYPEASKMLDRNIYMDDLLAGGHSMKEAIKRYEEIKQILLEAKMPLSKWNTTSPEIQQIWRSQGEDTCVKDQQVFSDASSKILGLHWRPATDQLYFGRELTSDADQTKRSLLSIASRLFDPLGLLGPFTIRAKLMMQELWKAAGAWDAQLTEPVRLKWKTWLEELPLIKNVTVPRCLFDGFAVRSSTWELHVFCDASEVAYGAAVYCLVRSKANMACHLVVSRNRVAPLKKITLPRLELMAALLGSRLLHYSLKALDIPTEPEGIHFWTDSQICLCWIGGDAGRWRTFVSNRVQEIQELTSPGSWRFIPGRENPADLLTRGIPAKQLLTEERWWHGPTWMQQPESEWPCFREDVVVDPEEERCPLVVVTVAVVEPLLEIGRFSTLSRLLRVTAWVMRMVPSRARNTFTLQAGELEDAKRYWIQVVQEEAFPEEISALRRQVAVPSKSTISQMKPFLDGPLLRMKTRIQAAPLPFKTLNPLILPPGGHFIQLLILDVHVTLHHAGVQEVLASLRENYWILRARRAINRALRRCYVCRRAAARAGSAPMGQLPAERVCPGLPFETTGVDFAGPLFMWLPGDAKSKAYVALFTCAVTRAVHAELVSSLSTEHFILALRRFFARYGICHTIWSDHGTTFRRTERELRALWDLAKTEKVQDFVARKQITWKYTAVQAPWWGGFWERLIRSLKERVRKLFRNQILRFEEVSTVLLELSAALNSRPLTWISETTGDQVILTPSHFICGARLTSLPDVHYSPNTDSSRESLGQRWKRLSQITQSFWHLWQQDYLLLLRNFHQDPTTGRVTPIAVGDLVLVDQPLTPRHCWPTAVVNKIFPSNDGKVRYVELRTASGSLLRRPIQKIRLLEA